MHMDFEYRFCKKQQSENTINEYKNALLVGNKTTDKDNASVNKHQHQHHIVISK